LVREERRHAGGRKSGQSRCGKTGERQRPDGSERIDTRPRLAAGVIGTALAMTGIRVSGEQRWKTASALDPALPMSRKYRIGCRHRPAVGGRVSSAGRAAGY